MSQTLLGIAALFSFSTLVENAALDVAMAWAGRVKDYGFDEADVGMHSYDIAFTARYINPLDFDVVSASPTAPKEVTITAREVKAASTRAPVEVNLDVPLSPAKLFLHK